MWKAVVELVPERGFVFPVDMLRYDACHPETEADSARISRTLLSEHAGLWLGEEPVRVTRYAGGKRDAERFTPARWRSFGWRVVGIVESRRLE